MPTNVVEVTVTIDTAPLEKAMKEVRAELEEILNDYHRQRYWIFWRLTRWYSRKRAQQRFKKLGQKYPFLPPITILEHPE